MTTTPATLTADQYADAAEIFIADPAVRAVAFWSDAHGATYVQGQATVDNRMSRVLARARTYVPTAHSLVVIHRPRG
jgi:hypothetical protein